MFPRRRDAAPGTQPDLQTAAEGHADVRPALLSYRILTPNTVRSTERLGPRRADGAVQSSAAARAEERSPPRAAARRSRQPGPLPPRPAPRCPTHPGRGPLMVAPAPGAAPGAARRRCSRPALLPGHETAGTPPGGAAPPPPPSHSAPVWPGLHSTGTAEPRHAAARTPPRTPGSWQPSLAAGGCRWMDGSWRTARGNAAKGGSFRCAFPRGSAQSLQTQAGNAPCSAPVSGCCWQTSSRSSYNTCVLGHLCLCVASQQLSTKH